MNVKFLNPFVEAANEVLEAEAQTVMKRGNLTLQKSSLTADEVTVMLSLVGQVQGVVFYGMSVATGLALVSRVMAQQFKTFDALAQSGVAELGNVITGRASIKLAEAGYIANISPPALIQGQSVTISTFDFSRIVVPLSCEFGNLMVHLAVRESPSNARNANYAPVVGGMAMAVGELGK
ncbi:MAG: chemotaxis protein CheX [Chloroflexi bacterium]|nr:chemotaxis protein CheX [Chloroflexota bacterium]